jgi:hypothetical protein
MIHRQTVWRSHKLTFVLQNKEIRLKDAYGPEYHEEENVDLLIFRSLMDLIFSSRVYDGYSVLGRDAV